MSPSLADGQPRSSCSQGAEFGSPNRPWAIEVNRPYLGARIAHKIAIVNFSAANLIGGLVFGSIGFVAFIYGKRMNLWKPMLLGLGLMVYPYFVADDKIMLAIGIFGSTALFFVRD